MLGLKTGIVLALALTMAGAAPALAGMNGSDYLNYIEAARRSQASQQASPARAEWQGVWASARPAPRATEPLRPYPHRYYGGPKSVH